MKTGATRNRNQIGIEISTPSFRSRACARRGAGRAVSRVARQHGRLRTRRIPAAQHDPACDPAGTDTAGSGLSERPESQRVLRTDPRRRCNRRSPRHGAALGEARHRLRLAAGQSAIAGAVRVLGDDRIRCCSADSLDALEIAVFRPGDQLGWHFDNSEFSVTIMLQDAHEGGQFDYVPGPAEPRRSTAAINYWQWIWSLCSTRQLFSDADAATA